jgi:hypothetical protein
MIDRLELAERNVIVIISCVRTHVVNPIEVTSSCVERLGGWPLDVAVGASRRVLTGDNGAI